MVTSLYNRGQERASNVLTITLCLLPQDGDSPCTHGLYFLCYVGKQQAPATMPPPDIRTGNTGIHRTLGCAVRAKISRLVLNYRASTLNHSATSPFSKSSIYKTQIIVRLTKYYLLYYLCILTEYLAIYSFVGRLRRHRNLSQSSTFYPKIDMNSIMFIKLLSEISVNP